MILIEMKIIVKRSNPNRMVIKKLGNTLCSILCIKFDVL